jgi:hypothetical protein
MKSHKPLTIARSLEGLPVIQRVSVHGDGSRSARHLRLFADGIIGKYGFWRNDYFGRMALVFRELESIADGKQEDGSAQWRQMVEQLQAQLAALKHADTKHLVTRSETIHRLERLIHYYGGMPNERQQAPIRMEQARVAAKVLQGNASNSEIERSRQGHSASNLPSDDSMSDSTSAYATPVEASARLGQSAAIERNAGYGQNREENLQQQAQVQRHTHKHAQKQTKRQIKKQKQWEKHQLAKKRVEERAKERVEAQAKELAEAQARGQHKEQLKEKLREKLRAKQKEKQKERLQGQVNGEEQQAGQLPNLEQSHNPEQWPSAEQVPSPKQWPSSDQLRTPESFQEATLDDVQARLQSALHNKSTSNEPVAAMDKAPLETGELVSRSTRGLSSRTTRGVLRWAFDENTPNVNSDIQDIWRGQPNQKAQRQQSLMKRLKKTRNNMNTGAAMSSTSLGYLISAFGRGNSKSSISMPWYTNPIAMLGLNKNVRNQQLALHYLQNLQNRQNESFGGSPAAKATAVANLSYRSKVDMANSVQRQHAFMQPPSHKASEFGLTGQIGDSQRGNPALVRSLGSIGRFVSNMLPESYTDRDYNAGMRELNQPLRQQQLQLYRSPVARQAVPTTRLEHTTKLIHQLSAIYKVRRDEPEVQNQGLNGKQRTAADLEVPKRIGYHEIKIDLDNPGRKMLDSPSRKVARTAQTYRDLWIGRVGRKPENAQHRHDELESGSMGSSSLQGITRMAGQEPLEKAWLSIPIVRRMAKATSKRMVQQPRVSRTKGALGFSPSNAIFAGMPPLSLLLLKTLDASNATSFTRPAELASAASPRLRAQEQSGQDIQPTLSSQRLVQRTVVGEARIEIPRVESGNPQVTGNPLPYRENTALRNRELNGLKTSETAVVARGLSLGQRVIGQAGFSVERILRLMKPTTRADRWLLQSSIDLQPVNMLRSSGEDTKLAERDKALVTRRPLPFLSREQKRPVGSNGISMPDRRIDNSFGPIQRAGRSREEQQRQGRNEHGLAHLNPTSIFAGITNLEAERTVLQLEKASTALRQVQMRSKEQVFSYPYFLSDRAFAARRLPSTDSVYTQQAPYQKRALTETSAPLILASNVQRAKLDDSSINHTNLSYLASSSTSNEAGDAGQGARENSVGKAGEQPLVSSLQLANIASSAAPDVARTTRATQPWIKPWVSSMKEPADLPTMESAINQAVSPGLWTQAKGLTWLEASQQSQARSVAPISAARVSRLGSGAKGAELSANTDLVLPVANDNGHNVRVLSARPNTVVTHAMLADLRNSASGYAALPSRLSTVQGRLDPNVVSHVRRLEAINQTSGSSIAGFSNPASRTVRRFGSLSPEALVAQGSIIPSPVSIVARRSGKSGLEASVAQGAAGSVVPNQASIVAWRAGLSNSAASIMRRLAVSSPRRAAAQEAEMSAPTPESTTRALAGLAELLARRARMESSAEPLQGLRNSNPIAAPALRGMNTISPAVNIVQRSNPSYFSALDVRRSAALDMRRSTVSSSKDALNMQALEASQLLAPVGGSLSHIYPLVLRSRRPIISNFAAYVIQRQGFGQGLANINSAMPNGHSRGRSEGNAAQAVLPEGRISRKAPGSAWTAATMNAINTFSQEEIFHTALSASSELDTQKRLLQRTSADLSIHQATHQDIASLQGAQPIPLYPSFDSRTSSLEAIQLRGEKLLPGPFNNNLEPVSLAALAAQTVGRKNLAGSIVQRVSRRADHGVAASRRVNLYAAGNQAADSRQARITNSLIGRTISPSTRSLKAAVSRAIYARPSQIGTTASMQLSQTTGWNAGNIQAGQQVNQTDKGITRITNTGRATETAKNHSARVIRQAASLATLLLRRSSLLENTTDGFRKPSVNEDNRQDTLRGNESPGWPLSERHHERKRSMDRVDGQEKLHAQLMLPKPYLAKPTPMDPAQSDMITIQQPVRRESRSPLIRQRSITNGLFAQGSEPEQQQLLKRAEPIRPSLRTAGYSPASLSQQGFGSAARVNRQDRGGSQAVSIPRSRSIANGRSLPTATQSFLQAIRPPAIQRTSALRVSGDEELMINQGLLQRQVGQQPNVSQAPATQTPVSLRYSDLAGTGLLANISASLSASSPAYGEQRILAKPASRTAPAADIFAYAPRAPATPGMPTAQLEHKQSEQKTSYPDSASSVSLELLKPQRQAEPELAPASPQPTEPAELTDEQISELVKQLPQFDVNQIVDKVTRELERRMRFERQRRGM